MPETAKQAELFTVCALCGGSTWRGRGRLMVTSTPDGRVVIRLEDGTTRGTWLELLASDVDWLAAVLSDIRTQRAEGEQDGA